MSIDRDRLSLLSQDCHFYKGRYRNLERTPRHGFREFMRWQRESGGRLPRGQAFPVDTPDLRLQKQQPELTWLGHASFLFSYGGCSLLTDPVFSRRVSPVQFAGPRRYTAAPLTVAQLPPIHQVFISHNHYDHLDHATVVALHQRFGHDLQWYVPRGVAGWFRSMGIVHTVELGWWQSHASGWSEAFCVPAQHFSGRGLRDRNKTQWCGWVIDFEGFRLYFAGDTGYGSCFRTLGDIFGHMDLSLLPIGAYAPRWFMAPVHVNPEEAARIHQDVKSRLSVGMHWGTFVLTAEPMDEPPRKLAEALERFALCPEEFITLRHGQTLHLKTNE